MQNPTEPGLHVIDASKQGWGIINHDLFLSNAQIRQVIRRAIDGRGRWDATAVTDVRAPD